MIELDISTKEVIMRVFLRVSGEFFFSVILASFLIFDPCFGRTTGRLKGKVENSYGYGLEAVIVTATQDSTGLVRRTITNKNGVYDFIHLRPGVYEILFKKPGFTTTKKNVLIRFGEAKELRVVMEPGRTFETLKVVLDNHSALNPSIYKNAINLNKETMDVLPVSELSGVSQDPTDLELENDKAGIVGDFPFKNTYLLNGMEVNQDKWGSPIPWEFFQQVRIQTGAIPVEFNYTGGAIIESVTKRGTNQLDFDLSMPWSPQPFRANQPDSFLATNSLGERDMVAIRFSIGGPIIEDRSHYRVFYSPEEHSQQLHKLNRNRKTNTNNSFAGLLLDFSINNLQSISLTGIKEETSVDSSWFNFNKQSGIETRLGQINRKGDTESLLIEYVGLLPYNLSVTGDIGWQEGTKINSSPADSFERVDDIRDPIRELRGLWINTQPGSSSQKTRDIHIGVNYLNSFNYFGKYDFELSAGYQQSDKKENLRNSHSGNIWYRFLLNGPGGFVHLPEGETIIRVESKSGSGKRRTEKSAGYFEGTISSNNGISGKAGVRAEEYTVYNLYGERIIRFKYQIAPRFSIVWDFSNKGSQKIYINIGRYSIPFIPLDFRFLGEQTGSINYHTLARESLLGNEVPDLGALLATYPLRVAQVKPNQLTDTLLKPMYEDEVSIGFARRLGKRYTLKTHAMYRRLGRAIAPVNVDFALNRYLESTVPHLLASGELQRLSGFEHLVLTNPGTNLIFSTDLNGNGLIDEPYEQDIYLDRESLGYPKPARNFRSLEISLERDFAENWFVRGHYVLSRLYGNFGNPGDGEMRANESGFFQPFGHPGLSDGSYGDLPGDRRHKLKVQGGLKLDIAGVEVKLGSSFSLVSGRPINSWAYHPNDSSAHAYGRASFYDGAGNLIPRGSLGTTESIDRLDLKANLEWNIGNLNHTAHIGLVVFNVFNRKGVTEVFEFAQIAPGVGHPKFGEPISYQEPRGLRLTVRFQY